MADPNRPTGDWVELEPGRLWVRDCHVDRLRAAGLDRFDALMGIAGGEVFRKFGTRLTVRLEIGGRPLYLKRHQQITETDGWAAFLGLAPKITDARREWENIWHLRRVGIRTAEPAALGESGPRSLLLLEEISDAEPADTYLARKFPLSVPTRVGAKRRLLERIGSLVRRLHDAGFYHRDLYLCHIFVSKLVKDGMPDPDLSLIDLQRVRRQVGGPGRRWRVKDLAQLNYSAREDFMNRQDRWCLLRSYFGSRPDADAKQLLRAVFRKTERIRRHDREK